MSSEPEEAQLALTAGSQGAGIYFIVKSASNEHTRKQEKRLVSRKDHELDKIIFNLVTILEKPGQTLPVMLGDVQQHWFGGTV